MSFHFVKKVKLALIFFVFSAFLGFPSFLISSTGFLSQASFHQFKNLKEFSFELKPLEEKVFKKARRLYLKKELKEAFYELEKFTEEKIRALIYKKASFFEKIAFRSPSQNSEEEKKFSKKIHEAHNP